MSRDSSSSNSSNSSNSSSSNSSSRSMSMSKGKGKSKSKSKSSTWGMVLASEKNCRIGYRLVSVGVSVGMVHELPQTIFLVLFKRKAS